MKKLATLFTVIIATMVTFTVSAQTNSVTVAELTGHWVFAGKATSSVHEVQQNSGFEYTFNANGTVTYKSGEIRPFTIKGKNISIIDKTGNTSIVHIDNIGKDEMTVITDYNTPSASAAIVFKKVK